MGERAHALEAYPLLIHLQRHDSGAYVGPAAARGIAMHHRSLLATLTVAAVTALSVPALASPPQIVSVGSQQARGSQPGAWGETVPSGATIRAQLHTTISTHDTAAGTPFTASVRTPLYDRAGREILPVGSQVVGHVANLSRSSPYGGHATISLAVDGLNVFGTFVPADAQVVSESSVQAHRSGLLQRQHATLPAGSDLTFQLRQPLAVRDLARAARLQEPVKIYHFVQQPVSVGGGPASPARPHHVTHHRPVVGAQCPAGCTATH